MKSRLKLVKIAADAQPHPVALEIRGLRKLFSTASGYLNVLEGIDCTVPRGQLVCILGRSGCGKTTLLNILAGFVTPSAGIVRLEGVPVTRPGPERGVVFQEDALFPWLTVRENIAFGLHGRRSRGQVRPAVDEYLALVGLSEFADYLPREISGGMKQRVALARVLILQPRVLLMDEPFGALDAQTREEMQNLLLALWGRFGHTILFVTHDVHEAVALADRILLMDRAPGRIREDIRVDLARPRQKDAAPFLTCCRRLFEGLGG